MFSVIKTKKMNIKNIFKSSELSIVNLAMLSYPITALTIEQKLALLKKKGFKQANWGRNSELAFEKPAEKLITSNGYQVIDVPVFIQELAYLTHDDSSWYTYYETTSRKKFESLFRYKHHKQYMIYYIETKDKIISYYRIKVRPMATDVVVLEVIEVPQSAFTPHGHKDTSKFYVRSFLSADDFHPKQLEYSNQLLKLPIDLL